MKTLRYILLLVMLMIVSCAFSQAVKTDYDKKIIITDSLNIPGNTSASTVISLLPELLQRPGDYILSNYDVKIEGMSVGSAADVALLQLQIVDIEKIEVSESALSSYQKNGQGGSINLVLRSSGSSADDRFWGSVGMHGSTFWDLAQRISLGYKDKGLMVRGIILGEMTDANRDVWTSVYGGGGLVKETMVRTESRFRTELARAYLQYNITKQDQIKFAVSEIYSYSKNRNITNNDVENRVTGIDKNLDVQANLSYKHSMKRGSIGASIEFGHKPSDKDNYAPDKFVTNKKKSNVISGKVDYQTTLFNDVNASGRRRKGELTIGVNFNTSLGSEKEHIDKGEMTTNLLARDIPQNDTRYIMPNATFNTTLGKLRLKASGGWQYFSYTIERSGKSHSAVSKDLTGKLMAEWHFTNLRKVRFILDRKLKRPSSSQLYPFLTMNSDQSKYIEGNPDLRPMMVHEAMFDYIDTYNFGQGHQLVVNTDISIRGITDIIGEEKSTRPDPIDKNANANYVTYVNRGSNTVTSANLMALYTYKAFSLSFTGNIYHKEADASSGGDYYTYYNLCLFPSFRIKNGWNGGARFVYYSHVYQRYSSLGDCAAADITVGKSINRLFFYLNKCFSFNKNSIDVSTSGNQRKEKKYEMLSSYTGIGVKYIF